MVMHYVNAPVFGVRQLTQKYSTSYTKCLPFVRCPLGRTDKSVPKDQNVPNAGRMHTGVWHYRKVHGGRVISVLQLAHLTRQACNICLPALSCHSLGVSHRSDLTRWAGVWV